MARFTWPWFRGERFSSWSVGDPAFAAWLRGEEADGSAEVVTPYTVLGLSAVLRSVSVISTTIAGLPLRTYERQGNEKERVSSVFDDPYPGIDGMTPFAWVETVLIHLLLWRNAYLWHDARDTRTGDITVYRPINPDAISKVELVNGRKEFTYTDAAGAKQVVGSEMLTHIPGPSLDGAVGHPFLASARAIFSGAISGDKAAQVTLRRGIRLAGLLVPEEGEEVDETEGNAILEQLRSRVVGREHAGDVALINRRMKLQPWTPNNIEMQWAETRQMVLGEIERLFGMPPHLLADTEKQTSWGTGVAEQNLGLSRYTLRGWSDRIEQTLSRRLPDGEFCEFDYVGLLQGTPADEIGLLIDQVSAGILTVDEARRIRNLPPLTAAQKRAMKPPAPPPPVVQAMPDPEPVAASAERDGLSFMRWLDERPAPVVNVTTPAIRNEFTVTPAPVTVAIPDVSVTVEPAAAPEVTVNVEPTPVSVAAAEVTVNVEPTPVTVEAPEVTVNVPEQRATTKRVIREGGQITRIIEEPTDG